MPRFRFIECTTDPLSRFAFDEVGMEYAGRTGEGIVVFYRMENNTVSIARLQSLTDVNLGAAKAYGLGVVRRPTSGSSVIHNDVAGDFSYSVILPFPELPTKQRGFPDTTKFRVDYSCEPIIRGLRGLDIEAEIIIPNNIAVAGEKRKISSNSFASNRDFYRSALVHGYIAYSADRDAWQNVLGDPGTQLVTISELSSATSREAYSAILAAFRESLFAKDCYEQQWTEEEKTTAQVHVDSLYANAEWTENARDPRGTSLWTAPKTKSFPSCVSLWPDANKD